MLKKQCIICGKKKVRLPGGIYLDGWDTKHKRRKRYNARLEVNGIRHRIGRYLTSQEAEKALIYAIKRLWVGGKKGSRITCSAKCAKVHKAATAHRYETSIPQITKACVICGKLFLTWEKHSRKTCSRKCSRIRQIATNRIQKRNYARLRSQTRVTRCDNCGEALPERKPDKHGLLPRGPRKFCSDECSIEKQKINHKGYDRLRYMKKQAIYKAALEILTTGEQK